MKSLVISIFLINLFGLSNGQSRIGHTLNSLKKEFSNPSFHLSITEADSTITLEILTTESRILYFIESDSQICEMTVIYPYSESIKDKLIERYNSRYFRVSADEWKTEIEDEIQYHIKLRREKLTSNICFIWTYETWFSN